MKEEITTISPTSSRRLDSAHRFDKDARAVYEELVARTNKLEFDFEAALSTIRGNPIVKDRLLQIANSLTCRLDRKIEKPRHALALLGAAGVRRMSEAALRRMNSDDERMVNGLNRRHDA